MRRFLLFVASWLRLRVIFDRDGRSPYLSRYYALGGPRTWDEQGSNQGETYGHSWLPFNVMLHRFHRSDDDWALHNHPWKWSLSLILAGGYVEERRVKTRCRCMPGCPYEVDRVARRVKRPWSLNVIRASDFHRVDLIEKDCWTLFIAGPKQQSWGFWDRVTGVFTPWREFIAARRAVKNGKYRTLSEAGAVVRRIRES